MSATNNINCCVFGCNSKKGRTSDLSFHQFPQENGSSVYITNQLGVKERVDRYEAWIDNLKLAKPPTRFMKVCSLHFTRNDFILPNVPSKKPRLKKTAVPTENLPNHKSDKQTQLGDVSVIDGMTDRELYLMTGIPNFAIFNKIVKKCANTFGRVATTVKLNVKECILLTLVKLKNGLTYADLPALFNVSVHTCRKIFTESIVLLAKVLKSLIYFPSIGTIMLIDCFEIPVQSVESLKNKIQTHSNYKQDYVIKYLIAVSSPGRISFVSKRFGGMSSDNMIFNQSGLLEKLKIYADDVIVDRGFIIQNVDDFCVKIVRPSTLKKKEFTEDQVLLNKRSVEARVQTEQVNQKIRTFEIFKTPLSFSFWPIVDDIFTVACAVANLSNPSLDHSRFLED